MFRILVAPIRACSRAPHVPSSTAAPAQPVARRRLFAPGAALSDPLP